MRVLIVEDDRSTCQSMELMLKSEGFQVYSTDLGDEAVGLARHYDYDAITLDLNLPDMSGYDVIRQIRGAGLSVPIIVVSGTADVFAKVKAIRAGADDYMTKPFHKDELVARLHALIRRSHGHSEMTVRAGELTVNLERRTASVGEQDVHLTGKEWAVLEVLALKKDRTVSKEALFDHLYNGTDEPEGPKIIDVFVCKLRKKLAAAGVRGVIETIWGAGYRLSDPPPDAPSTDAVPPIRLPLRPIADQILCALIPGPASNDDLAVRLGHTDSWMQAKLRELERVGAVSWVRGGRPRHGPAVFALTEAGRQRASAQAS